MTFDGAIIREQGVTFAVAVVRRGIINNPSVREDVAVEFSVAFDGLPTVLMEQSSRGVPRFWGRPDLVRFLANVPVEAIPFRRWTVN